MAFMQLAELWNGVELPRDYVKIKTNDLGLVSIFKHIMQCYLFIIGATVTLMYFTGKTRGKSQIDL